MKKTLLFSTVLFLASISHGQGQIGNSDFELWETVASDQEPVNWNSFLTATGGWAWAAANQIESSTDVRPGSTGTMSARIWSRSAFGIIANGNMTLGQINMGSTTPTDASNYNFSKTSDTDFSESLTDAPDSLVFWVKYNPVNAASNARVKATLHDNYDYRDPEDATSSTHVVAIAELNYGTTNGAWVRKSIPFNYTGPATGNTHILVTFTTNEAAGGGDANDEVFVDDVELIYNPSSLDEQIDLKAFVYMNNEKNILSVQSKEGLNGQYVVYSMSGTLVQEGSIEEEISFEHECGVYIVKLIADNKFYTQRIVKL